MHTTFEQLLLKKLLGTITAKEELDFNLWLKANPAYCDTYSERKREWEVKQAEAPEFTLYGIGPTVTRSFERQKPNSGRFHIANIVAMMLMIAATFLFYRGVSVGARKITAGDRVMPVVLNDSTMVSLKPHSTIVVPAGFPSTRTLDLQGQAYFKVKHIPGKPLIINTRYSRIEVAGTSFVVMENEQKKQNEVIVFDGLARLSGKQNINKSVIVTPGMNGKVVNQIDQPTLAHTDTVNLIAWKTDQLKFRNSTLYDVASIISDYYGVDVHVHDGLGCQFTATFNSVTLDEVLEALGESIPVQITNNKNAVTLNAQTCGD